MNKEKLAKIERDLREAICTYGSRELQDTLAEIVAAMLDSEDT